MRAEAHAALTGCGTCGSELCPHEVCRTCGTCDVCDAIAAGVHVVKGHAEARALIQAGADDRAAMLAALRELKGTTCACGTVKQPAQSFCRRCWKCLPGVVQLGLYKRFSDGYMVYYRRALEILRDADRVRS